MRMYRQDLLVDILEARLLDSFEDYTAQGTINNKFIKYMYKYIKTNTYAGEQDELLRDLVNLQLNNPLFVNSIIKENTDRQTYQITDDTGITDEMFELISEIVKKYQNYHFVLHSPNSVEIAVKVKFGWLPPNTASWLNLINDECIVDYYIDGITLRPNTYSTIGGPPDSGYICFRISELMKYDTILFIANMSEMSINADNKFKITVASILTDIEGSKGATLNRIVETDLTDFFYELGPYARTYLTTDEASLIIQVPYEYAAGSYYHLFDVSNAVKINNKNNKDENNKDNYFVSLDDPNYNNMFIKNDLKDKDALVEKILNNDGLFSKTLQQYLFGDFIWKTSDSKLIAYAQKLINSLYQNNQLIPNGVWDDTLTEFILKFKTNSQTTTIFDDDVIDKITEEAMLAEYRILHPGLDPNEELFNVW